jgi:SulP family sulfate permease
MIGLAKTTIGTFSSVIAIVVPTALTIWLSGVAAVEDAGAIPTGIPLPHLPNLHLVSFDLVTGAFAVAVIVLVQGVGVSESAPNSDGIRAEPNRDFVAHAARQHSVNGHAIPTGSSGELALRQSSGGPELHVLVFAGDC